MQRPSARLALGQNRYGCTDPAADYRDVNKLSNKENLSHIFKGYDACPFLYIGVRDVRDVTRLLIIL